MNYNHCAWLADDASVWTSGDNYYGQLGLGDNTARNRPSRLPNLPPFSSVQSGHCGTLCLDTSGCLWSFGYNRFGQLGLGDATPRCSPHMVLGIPPVRSFCFHCRHSIILCEDGSIWSFGYNDYGQLGLEHKGNHSTPVQLPTSLFPSEIVSVKCGYYHSLFLTSEGQVLACGYNGNGQLGQGDFANRSTPTLILNMKDFIKIACGGNMSCMIDRSHRLWVCGSHFGTQSTPLCFPSIGLIQKISVGCKHILCINQSGELWGWGNPSSGELGPTAPCATPMLLKNNIKDCLCIGNCSFIRNADGEDFCSGKNSSGQLGLGNTINHEHFSKFPPEEEEEEEEQFRMCFPVEIRKFSQKSARSAIPLPE